MEYGRIVGESTGVGGGRGGGAGDVTGQVMNTLGDAVDQIASLPPPVLIALVAVVLIGLFVFRR
jgi:hypothetical protein